MATSKLTPSDLDVDFDAISAIPAYDDMVRPFRQLATAIESGVANSVGWEHIILEATLNDLTMVLAGISSASHWDGDTPR